jgi:hypothetical protein
VHVVGFFDPVQHQRLPRSPHIAERCQFEQEIAPGKIYRSEIVT